jgi:mannose-6-phosphate isomerase-like protein (cupin superfamily)
MSFDRSRWSDGFSRSDFPPRISLPATKKRPEGLTPTSSPFSFLPMAKYEITEFDSVEAVPCPCGTSKRAFMGPDNETASMHVTTISEDSRTHYHKTMTEFYYVLEGEGVIELDGETFPLKPNMAIMIKPGCRHRAVGNLKIINVPVPKFDPDDEWFD